MFRVDPPDVLHDLDNLIYFKSQSHELFSSHILIWSNKMKSRPILTLIDSLGSQIPGSHTPLDAGESGKKTP